MRKLLIVTLLIALILTVLPAAPVAAHGMTITYTLTPVIALRVDLVASDANGDPVNRANLAVYAPDATDPWIETRLGNTAAFSFVPDIHQPGLWTVTLSTDDAEATLNLPINFSTDHASITPGTAVSLTAHGMTVTTTLTEIVTVEVALAAEFDGGDPLDEGQVAVYTPDNAKTPWLTGTCDAEGRYTFVADITNAGRWDIQVRQAGHGEWLKIPLDADTVEMLHDTDAADDDAAQGMTTLRIADSAASGSSDGGELSAGQIVLMSASVIWGLVGTALYFARRKQERTH